MALYRPVFAINIRENGQNRKLFSLLPNSHRKTLSLDITDIFLCSTCCFHKNLLKILLTVITTVEFFFFLWSLECMKWRRNMKTIFNAKFVMLFVKKNYLCKPYLITFHTGNFQLTYTFILTYICIIVKPLQTTTFRPVKMW